jgi:predicted alpha-1,2-mannosidase
MVGDPAVPVIADTYLKGIRGYDTVLAYAAVKKAATHQGAEAARPGYADQLSLGYIPYDQDTTQQWWVWGPVSSTLEYCYADWCISRMAEHMGHQEDAAEFRRRSLLYRNLFDHETTFLRPRKRDGSWLIPFDPAATEGSASWAGSGGPGYVEGSAWNYTWFVPHDIDGLITLFGSSDRFASKLERCFAESLFTVTNEPDIAYPYLFTYIPGKAHRTPGIIRDLRQRWFHADAAGLPGNDDAGTISAWYVFSALGLYPACPGSNEYRLGMPLFERLSFPVCGPQGKPGTVTIEKKRGDPAVGNGTVLWNGVRLPHRAIAHEDLTRGGTLTFVIEDR